MAKSPAFSGGIRDKRAAASSRYPLCRSIVIPSISRPPSLWAASHDDIMNFINTNLQRGNKQMNNTKSEEYVVCPRCKQEVFKGAITCPFCHFGIMAWIEGEVDENGDLIKDKSR